MHRWFAVILCVSGVLGTSAISTQAQVSSVSNPGADTANTGPEPLRVASGTILTFHLQTRLRPSDADPIDGLPQGTLLHVKILRAIDSTTQRDGSEFHGWVVSDLALGDGVVIHADSEVRGLLVLLRSKNHPDGFRYELLLTELTDNGKSYPLTASLNASFFDGPQPAVTKVEAKASPKPGPASNNKAPAAAQ